MAGVLVGAAVGDGGNAVGDAGNAVGEFVGAAAATSGVGTAVTVVVVPIAVDGGNVVGVVADVATVSALDVQPARTRQSTIYQRIFIYAHSSCSF